MINWIKWIAITLLSLIVITTAASYVTLRQSLPTLDGQIPTTGIKSATTLERDRLGQAVIKAQSIQDAMYTLGYAHGQDRFFQMDAQRRSAAGELAEWLGPALIDIDKKVRFHQFRKRAQNIFAQLPKDQQDLLTHYAQGVNEAIDHLGARPVEHILTGFDMTPWLPEDSILVAFSMYISLQLSQVEHDLVLSEIERHFGESMVTFLTQPSQYQSPLDGSIMVANEEIPHLETTFNYVADIQEPVDVGSNNWAVSGDLTETQSAMLSNDMHLGLRVPIIWYRAELNYTRKDEKVKLNGVSLPGLPGIVVGTNGHIAWGFTNSNLDNVDWVLLDKNTQTWTETETIKTTEGEHNYAITMSHIGPVRELDGNRYALKWVAHQPYAIDLDITNFDLAKSIQAVLPIAHKIGIPVQNLTMADANGNIAWTPGGAVTARPTPSYTAIAEQEYSELWNNDENTLPVFSNPEHGRIWTGNARVISAEQMKRFGDGGYAIGARQLQIRDRLFEFDTFDEDRFYAIQLDNEARFISVWHDLLSTVLSKDKTKYQTDLAVLADWQKCACPESIGYTLARRYRSQVINALMTPLAVPLEKNHLGLKTVIRHAEPAIWELLRHRPDTWLPSNYDNWDGFLAAQYDIAKQKLEQQFKATDDMSSLAWGNVNALKVKHPIGERIPVIGQYFHMIEHPGFGDSFMPSVQAPQFGASQRLFVQPGHLENAILTLPGGQSGHILSPYYRAGFDDYVSQRKTPLLPQTIEHTLKFEPMENHRE